MTLDEWLAAHSLELHREARHAWRASARRRLHQASREFAERAVEARQLRDMLRAVSPNALSIIELEHLERMDENALHS